MKHKAIGICMLLMVATVLPVAGITNNETGYCLVNSINGEDEWTMFLHDPERTGYSTSSAPNTDMLKWVFEGPGGCIIGIDCSPAVVNNKVYISTWDEYFYCLDADTGEELWSYYDDMFAGCSPAVYESKVYVSSDYYFYCFNADTGDVVWKYDIEFRGSHPSPVIVDGKVYYAHSRSTTGSGDACLYCFDANTGNKFWEYNFGYISVSSPAVAYGRVYVSSDDEDNDEKMNCFDASTGKLLWAFDIGKYGMYTPTIYDGRLYFGGDVLYCLNSYTGKQIWTYNVSKPIVCSPTIAYGNIYFQTSAGSEIYCLDLYNVSKIWSYPIGQLMGMTPVVADNKVYAGTWGFSAELLLCLNASTGEVIWEYDMSGAAPFWSCAPSVAYGRLFMGGGDTNKLYCFEDPFLPAPTIDGQKEGFVNCSYNFDVVTNEPNSNKVRYFVDWDDGTSEWTDYYNSGEEVTISHMWNNSDMYSLHVHAESIKGFRSKWSIHNITIIDGAMLEIQAIKGGLFKVTTIIKNLGTRDAVGVNWSILLDGGLILLGKKTTGKDNIPVDDEITVISKSIVGFGSAVITVNATVPIGFSDTREQKAFIFLVFINVKLSG